MGDDRFDDDDDLDLDYDEDEFTDTDLFDAESIARQVEELRPRHRRTARASARERIEELRAQRELERALDDYDDEDFDLLSR